MTVSQAKLDYFRFCDNFDKSRQILTFFTVKFRNGSAEKLGFKLAPLLESVAALPCEKQVFNYKVVLFYFLCGYFLNLTVKNYLKCVHFCRSYRENKNDLLFSETPCSSFARVISLMWLFAI